MGDFYAQRPPMQSLYGTHNNKELHIDNGCKLMWLRKGYSPALAGREALAEETLIVSLSGFMRHTQAPIVAALC